MYSLANPIPQSNRRRPRVFPKSKLAATPSINKHGAIDNLRELWLDLDRAEDKSFHGTIQNPNPIQRLSLAKKKKFNNQSDYSLKGESVSILEEFNHPTTLLSVNLESEKNKTKIASKPKTMNRLYHSPAVFDNLSPLCEDLPVPPGLEKQCRLRSRFIKKESISDLQRRLVKMVSITSSVEDCS